MWQRIIRLLTAGLNMYSFYANPLKNILSLLMILLVPYLAYIFWGSLIIIILSCLGIYMLYKLISNAAKGSSYS
ncbi:hypothetical protein G3570_10990 [Balneolaceae bacterium YR4-1]|uniref:Uncharacterized protein n=1 Tax=Halalkalibaculum roseum TaxID=2709311 RepID=A0A6M1SW61_9BACT|nr:hypothetical protein [Halalkalibaculum roseum]NGP77162.1 hypothetical protein [Halalkalibaculum roseum]